MEASKLMKHGYAALRKDESGEWLDTGSFGVLEELAQEKIATLEQQIPDWAKANPVQRIIRVMISPLEEPASPEAPCDRVCPPAIQDDIKEIINYNWGDEEKDYEYCLEGSGNQNGVYPMLVRIYNWLYPEAPIDLPAPIPDSEAEEDEEEDEDEDD